MDNKQREEAVKKVIEKARPYLQADGGDVEFVSLEEDVVYVKVFGACAGCGLLDATLKDGIEAMILDEVEGIKEVKLADVSEDELMFF